MICARPCISQIVSKGVSWVVLKDESKIKIAATIRIRCARSLGTVLGRHCAVHPFPRWCF